MQWQTDKRGDASETNARFAVIVCLARQESSFQFFDAIHRTERIRRSEERRPPAALWRSKTPASHLCSKTFVFCEKQATDAVVSWLQYQRH